MTVQLLTAETVPGAVALQAACFPPPFPQEYHWKPAHLRRHVEIYPEGQFVVMENGFVVGCASSCILSEDNWQAHRSWYETVGGPMANNHDPNGTTLYGLDICVNPDYRRRGIGRLLYQARFDLVRREDLGRYGTGCRLPGYLSWSSSAENSSVEGYVQEVLNGKAQDRTLTPLLRYGLKFLDVIHDYMEDVESADSAVLLEWKP